MLAVSQAILAFQMLLVSRCIGVDSGELPLVKSDPSGYRGLKRMKAELMELYWTYNRNVPDSESEWSLPRVVRDTTAGKPGRSPRSGQGRSCRRQPSTSHGHRAPYKEGLEVTLRTLRGDPNHHRGNSPEGGLSPGDQGEPPTKAMLKQLLSSILRSKYEHSDIEQASVVDRRESRWQRKWAGRGQQDGLFTENVFDAELQVVSHHPSTESTMAIRFLDFGVAASLTMSFILFFFLFFFGKSMHYF